MFDFRKSIENAQQLPEAPSHENPIPDIFRSEGFHKMVEAVAAPAGDEIAGIAKYDFVFESARLQIGKEQVDYVNGQAIYEDRNDSARLKEIMDKCLGGKAILNKKVETFLKDGTVVLWIEWLEPRTPREAKKEKFLSTAELLSPELITEESRVETTSSESSWRDFGGIQGIMDLPDDPDVSDEDSEISSAEPD